MPSIGEKSIIGGGYVYCLLFMILRYSCAKTDTFRNSNLTHNDQQRTGRLSLVRFASSFTSADSCKTTSGVFGSCLSLQDCSKRGGKGTETCAWGLGVCCVHTVTCGGTSSSNMTHFVSPGYPSAWKSQTGVCSVTIQTRRRFSPRICQLRLDFDDFYINGVDETLGQCSTDMLVISGQDLNNVVPIMCGQNSGQHIYLNVGSSGGPIRLTVTTTGESTERKWKVRITQLECGNEATAPAFCLQYFTGTVGTIKSFNYGNVKDLENGYPVNLNYATCLRKEAGMCGATFTPDGNFAVDVERSGSSCNLGDYLNIGTNRICGDSNAITDNIIRHANNGPMIVTFVSDSSHRREDVGFNIRYTQFACSSGQ